MVRLKVSRSWDAGYFSWNQVGANVKQCCYIEGLFYEKGMERQSANVCSQIDLVQTIASET
jgi:hypothetical protein